MSKSKEKIPMEKSKEKSKTKTNKQKINQVALDDLLKNGINGGKNWKDSVPGQEIEEKPLEDTEDKTENKDSIIEEPAEIVVKEKPQKSVKKLKDELAQIEQKKDKNPRKKSKKENSELKQEIAIEEKPEEEKEELMEKPTQKELEVDKFEYIKKLGYRELTKTINRIYNLELIRTIRDLRKTNPQKAEEELEKISVMEERAGYLLGNAEKFAGQGELSEEKIESIKKECFDLKMAKEKLIGLLKIFKPEEKKEIDDSSKKPDEENLDELSYNELTVKINDYILKTEEQFDTINKKQIEEKLQEIFKLGDMAGEFLGNAWGYVQRNKLNQEEQAQFHNRVEELKNARNKLRTLYMKLSFGITPKEEKKSEQQQEITTEQESATPSIDESLMEIAKNVEISQEEKFSKKKKMSFEEKQRKDLSDYSKWEIEEEQENVNRKINNLTEALKIATDENDKNLILQEKENLKKRAEIIDKILSEHKQESKIEQPQQAKEKEQKILEGAFEGFVSGEEIKKNVLEEINEGIAQKKQEIEETKKRLGAYKLWGPWGKQTTGRDFNWYADAGNFKILKKEFKQLKKERKQEIKQFKKDGRYKIESANVGTEEKKATSTLNKKQGFFAKLFGRKTKEPKKPKILSEKEILDSIKPVSKEWRRRHIDSPEGQDRFRKID